MSRHVGNVTDSKNRQIYTLHLILILKCMLTGNAVGITVGLSSLSLAKCVCVCVCDENVSCNKNLPHVEGIKLSWIELLGMTPGSFSEFLKILFSESNLWSRYCYQHRVPDETSKLLHPLFRNWLSWDQNRLLHNTNVSNHLMTPKKAGQKAAEHSRAYLVQNAMTAFQTLGCLWRQVEKEGALLGVLPSSQNSRWEVEEAVATKRQLLGLYSRLTGFEALEKPAKSCSQSGEQHTLQPWHYSIHNSCNLGKSNTMVIPLLFLEIH